MDPMIELDALLKSHGIVNFSATEIVRLGQRRGSAVNTMPPRHLWWHIIPTLNLLERVRQEVGGPIRVLSGWRSPEYNRAVRGSTGSLHTQFNAIDWRPLDFGPWKVGDLAEIVLDLIPNKLVGLGQYDDASPEDDVKTGFIHTDTRALVMGMKGAFFTGKS